ncbi:MAG: helix-hairpin-helix domain-containing protein [Flavobacteriaceae bacterium]|nr:helix-hairpin-helix domain-containing protein [Flavobacteriaceae bacterium]
MVWDNDIFSWSKLGNNHKRMKGKPLQNFLDLSVTEKRGVFTVLIIIAGITAYPFVYDWLYPLNYENASLSPKIKQALADLHKEEINSATDTFSLKTTTAEPNFFYFDPNNTSDSEFLELGLRPYQIRSINRYMENRGPFRFKEQFMHLHILDSNWVQLAEEYISLPLMVSVYPKYKKRNYQSNNYHKSYHNTPDSKPLINLNTADSESLEQLPGLGDWMAGKIVRYRNRLGGFHSISQLMEVRGLRAENYEIFKSRLTLSSYQKLRLNTCTVEELGKHPYLNFKLAKMIVNYRSTHGKLYDPAVLKALPLMADSTYQKILPYWDLE